MLHSTKRNASVAVQTGEMILLAVFLRKVSPDLAAPILLQHYNSKEDAEQLVMLGDFEVLAKDRESCKYAVDTGEDILDCLPECCSLEEYEENLKMAPYGYNYLFKDDAWWMVQPYTMTYKKLKKGELSAT